MKYVAINSRLDMIVGPFNTQDEAAEYADTENQASGTVGFWLIHKLHAA